jgi:hypothetical protein
MRLPISSKYLAEPGPFRGEEEGASLIFQWFPRHREVLSSLPLLPSFLQTAIQNPPESAQHIIHYNGERR